MAHELKPVMPTAVPAPDSMVWFYAGDFATGHCMLQLILQLATFRSIYIELLISMCLWVAFLLIILECVGPPSVFVL